MDDTNSVNSNYELLRCKNIHQIRNLNKGGGVPVYLYKNLQYKVRDHLSINCENVESRTVESFI